MQYEVRSEDLRRLAADLKGAANKDRRARLSKGLREPLKPAQAAVRARIRAMPSRGEMTGGHASRTAHRLKPGRHRGQKFGTLRSRLAAAVTIKVATSRVVTVRIYMDTTKLPDDQRALPRYVEGLAPWRHPVFGHDRWVQQKPYPYFFDTVLPYREAVQASMRQIVNEIAQEITRGT